MCKYIGTNFGIFIQMWIKEKVPIKINIKPRGQQNKIIVSVKDAFAKLNTMFASLLLLNLISVHFGIYFAAKINFLENQILSCVFKGLKNFLIQTPKFQSFQTCRFYIINPFIRLHAITENKLKDNIFIYGQAKNSFVNLR